MRTIEVQKQEIIKRITDLMAAIQTAYYNDALGERNSDDTGGDGCITDNGLWVHECMSQESGISIDLYNFGGDGKSVCDGLNPCTVTFDDGTKQMGNVFCMTYDPDEEETPLVFQFSFDKYGDGSDVDLEPDSIPIETLQNIAQWLEQMMPENKTN